ncbi:MAG: hypothetical protein MZW92_32395 [Comamonadaceae bacterium]|nr:hypothetical protein [Comamonadaceae bacterium]
MRIKYEQIVVAVRARPACSRRHARGQSAGVGRRASRATAGRERRDATPRTAARTGSSARRLHDPRRRARRRRWAPGDSGKDDITHLLARLVYPSGGTHRDRAAVELRRGAPGRDRHAASPSRRSNAHVFSGTLFAQPRTTASCTSRCARRTTTATPARARGDARVRDALASGNSPDDIRADVDRRTRPTGVRRPRMAEAALDVLRVVAMERGGHRLRPRERGGQRAARRSRRWCSTRARGCATACRSPDLAPP